MGPADSHQSLCIYQWTGLNTKRKTEPLCGARRAHTDQSLGKIAGTPSKNMNFQTLDLDKNTAGPKTVHKEQHTISHSNCPTVQQTQTTPFENT